MAERDHVRAHAQGIATAIWPGEQRQLQRWLDMGLIDIAFCSIFVSAAVHQSTALDSSYIDVDHGDQFRRQHAEAFPDARPAQVTIAASDWALDYLLRTDPKGYLPSRVAAPLIASGRLHRVEAAPIFLRRVHLVESARATQSWTWFEAAVVASSAR